VEYQDDVDANNIEDEVDVLCTAYVPAPTVAPSYDIDPLIEFNFSG
jgi:hypothetical protein